MSALIGWLSEQIDACERTTQRSLSIGNTMNFDFSRGMQTAFSLVREHLAALPVGDEHTGGGS